MPSDDARQGRIFECRQCGDCCRGYGGTYVADADLTAIAAHLKILKQELISRYTALSGARRLLVQGDNGYCAFWKDGLCGIHPVKPRMCREWPYLKSVIVDVGNWWAMAGSCPGMRTDVPREVVRNCVRAVRGDKSDIPA